MKKEAIELLQNRIQQEQLSSRIYEQMGLCMEDKGYFGAAKLWAKYSQEELNHANWAKDYLLSFNIKPELRKLEAPSYEYECLCDVIKATLDHETLITNQCNEFASKAFELKDHGLYSLALKYCSEQVEEMRKSYDLLNLIETFGTSKEALLLIDNKLRKL